MNESDNEDYCMADSLAEEQDSSDSSYAEEPMSSESRQSSDQSSEHLRHSDSSDSEISDNVPNNCDNPNMSDSDDSTSDHDLELVVGKHQFLIRHISISDAVDVTEERNTYIAKFESLYGSTHPVFFRGTYNQALDEAKRDLRFLLVYLHNEHHQDTDQFCRTVITSQRFIDFLSENNLVFWSASVTSTEGFRVSQHLRESTYPFLALIVVKQNRMVVVGKFEGTQPLETLLTQVKLAIEDNEAGLTAARIDRQQREMNTLLRREQDEAFAQSLRADQEKERKKMEEKTKKEAEEKVKKEKELEETMRKDRLLLLRDVLVKEIPGEPEPNDPNSCKLVIKLPNGTRLERRFLKNQSIRFLYYFVFCNKEAPINFQIRTNFPPRDLPSRPPQLENFAFKEDNTVERLAIEEAPTFEECDLSRGAMLFVHDLEA